MTTPSHLAVVGGGAAGTLLALAVLRKLPRATVTLIDRRSTAFGRGVAYGHGKACHRINIPALKMGGIDSFDEGGFMRWLEASGQSGRSFAETFVPRAIYGDYLEHALATARAGGRLRQVVTDVTSLRASAGGGWQVSGEGCRLAADRVALCPGNPAPSLAWPGCTGPRFVPDVWAENALAQVRPDDAVLLLGTGATAIDALLALQEDGHRGAVTMVSRRGLLPCIEVPPGPYAEFFDPAIGSRGLLAVMRRLRAETRNAAAHRIPWQHVIDAFRPHVAGVWLQLNDRDRRRFLRHLRAWWMVHRHRLAPDIDAHLTALRTTGRLSVRAARLRSVEVGVASCRVQLLQPGSDTIEPLTADWVLNCIGPAEDFARLREPLWRGLFASGTVRVGPFDLGIDVDAQLRVVDRAGRAHDGLYALGLPTRGRFWEVTAVSHIRQQAEQLAAHLARETDRGKMAPD